MRHRRRERRSGAREIEDGRDDARRAARSRREGRESLPQLRQDLLRLLNVERRVPRGAGALDQIGELGERRRDRPRRPAVHAPRLELEQVPGLSRLVDRKRFERRVEPRRVEERTDRAARLDAAPQELVESIDGPAAPQRRLEPRGAGRVARDVAAKRVAERAPERLASVDLSLFEAPAAREGVLAQHPVAEGVDGGDRRAVEDVQRALELLPGAFVEGPRIARADLLLGRRLALAGEQPLDLRPHSRADLVRRLLGERDAEQAVEREVRREHELDDEVLERERLARARRRVDDDVAIERDVPQHLRPHDAAHDRFRLMAHSPSLEPAEERRDARGDEGPRARLVGGRVVLRPRDRPVRGAQRERPLGVAEEVAGLLDPRPEGALGVAARAREDRLAWKEVGVGPLEQLANDPAQPHGRLVARHGVERHALALRGSLGVRHHDQRRVRAIGAHPRRAEHRVIHEGAQHGAIALGRDPQVVPLLLGPLDEGDRRGGVGSHGQGSPADLDAPHARDPGRVDEVHVEHDGVEDLARTRVLAGATEANDLEGVDPLAARFELGAPRSERLEVGTALSTREHPRGARATELATAHRVVVGLLERASTRDRFEEHLAQEHHLLAHVGLERFVLARHRVVVFRLVEPDPEPRPTLQRELEELHDRVDGDRDAALRKRRGLEQPNETQVIGQLAEDGIGAGAREDRVGREAVPAAVEAPAKGERARLGVRFGEAHRPERRRRPDGAARRARGSTPAPSGAADGGGRSEDRSHTYPRSIGVEELFDHRRRRERLAGERFASDVREIEAIARAEQELEEPGLVAVARREVALAPPRPAQIERILRLGRRELTFAHAAGEDDPKGHRPRRRERRDHHPLAGVSARKGRDAAARELAGDAVAHAAIAEVDVAQGVQAAQAARDLLLFRGPAIRN